MESKKLTKSEVIRKEKQALNRTFGLTYEQRQKELQEFIKFYEKTEREKKVGKILQYSTIAALLALAFFRLNSNDTDTYTTNTNESSLNIETGAKSAEEREDTLPIQEVEKEAHRFNQEVYETLPKYERDVYKYMSLKNPTPNRGYLVLNKSNATLDIFNKENKLGISTVAGFGKDKGDSPNTSYEYDRGSMTTPAGVYLMSNASSKKDIEEYGKLQFSMFGISVLGDKVFLGLHQTYSGHGELEKRTAKLASENVEDNRFSNGCINVDEGYFKRVIKKEFIGDGELIFVLPDDESSAEFNVDKLIRNIAPMIVDFCNQIEKIYEKSLQNAKNENEKSFYLDKILEIQERRKFALDLM